MGLVSDMLFDVVGGHPGGGTLGAFLILITY